MRSNDTNKLIAIGIPKELTDSGLNDMFSTFGSIVDAKVVYESGNQGQVSRGFGFVTFSSAASMKAAIHDMNRKQFQGRVLNVREVVPRENRVVHEKPTGGNDAQVCWAFKRGKCNNGKHCEFSHAVSSGDYGTCFEFAQNGECKRGDMCKFFHPENVQKLSQRIDEKEAPASPKQSNSTINSNTRVCYAYQNGKCHRGSKCRFSHEKLKIEKEGENFNSRDGTTKRKIDEEAKDVAEQSVKKIKPNAVLEQQNEGRNISRSPEDDEILQQLKRSEMEALESYNRARESRIKREQELLASSSNLQEDHNDTDCSGGDEDYSSSVNEAKYYKKGNNVKTISTKYGPQAITKHPAKSTSRSEPRYKNSSKSPGVDLRKAQIFKSNAESEKRSTPRGISNYKLERQQKKRAKKEALQRLKTKGELEL